MQIKLPPLTPDYIDELKGEYIGKPGVVTRGAIDGPLGRVYKRIVEDIKALNVPPPAPPPPPPAPPKPTQPEETQTP